MGQSKLFPLLTVNTQAATSIVWRLEWRCVSGGPISLDMERAAGNSNLAAANKHLTSGKGMGPSSFTVRLTVTGPSLAGAVRWAAIAKAGKTRWPVTDADQWQIRTLTRANGASSSLWRSARRETLACTGAATGTPATGALIRRARSSSSGRRTDRQQTPNFERQIFCGPVGLWNWGHVGKIGGGPPGDWGTHEDCSTHNAGLQSISGTMSREALGVTAREGSWRKQTGKVTREAVGTEHLR